MRNFETIGCTPHDEPCAQVGSEGYAQRARVECQQFMKQITKHYPEPDNGWLKIKSFGHDFGTYYEVVACFDDEDEASTTWAYNIEGDTLGVLATWDAEFHPINLTLEAAGK